MSCFGGQAAITPGLKAESGPVAATLVLAECSCATLLFRVHPSTPSALLRPPWSFRDRLGIPRDCLR